MGSRMSDRERPMDGCEGPRGVSLATGWWWGRID